MQRLYALLALTLVLAAAAAHHVQALEVDVIARLVYVVDGDTVRIVVVKACSERFSGLVGFEGRLRLADINAPELDTPEGVEAKKALEALLEHTPVLYIDVDDLYVYDRYGRIVGVLLVEYNETSLLNVNEWLLERGYAEPRDYPNEFRPHWSLYAPKSEALRACLEGGDAKAAETVTVTKTVTLWSTRTVTSTVTRWATETVTVATRETVTVATPVTITTVVTRPQPTGPGGCGVWLLVVALAAGLAGYLAGTARR